MNYFRFAGIRFDKVNLSESVKKVITAIEHNSKIQVCVTNVYSTVLMQKDTEFRKINNSTSLVVADGMPIIWVSKLMGFPLPCRIAGSDLFFELCTVASTRNYTFYFLGSKKEVLDKIRVNLKVDFPDLKIVGMYSPPYRDQFSEEENNDIVQKINEVKPDVLWVGMTAPKQEKWIFHNLDKLNVKVAIGVGAVFNFVAGSVPRAPVWMQKMGMEWFFRLIQEPKRLWKRYLIGNTIFLWLVLKEFIKIKILKKK